MFRGVCCSFASIIALSSASYAATPYVGGSAGFAFLNSSEVKINGAYVGEADYDTGEAFSGAIGLDNDGYRLEGEVAYQKNDIDNWGSDVSVLSVMANGYLDFQISNSKITPFVSAGISYAKVDVEYLGDDGDDSVLAFQLGAGIGFQISPTVTLDAKYRYFSTGSPEFEVGGNTLEMDIDSHNILLGLRVKF
jgi:opacity protein-like surface antigen